MRVRQLLAVAALSTLGLAGAGTAGPASATTTCTGVNVTPSSNIQSLIDANGEGTVFCFASGTYRLSTAIIPKAYDVLVGVPGNTILDGGNTATAAFIGHSGYQNQVTLKGLTIQHFSNNGVGGVIVTVQATDYWKLINNTIRYNGRIGVDVGSYVTLQHNRILSNGQYGVTGAGANVTLVGNTIASNNTKHYDVGDAGGTKFVATTNLKFKSNYVHDNYGPGLWTDGDNVNTTFDGNRVENNRSSGIFLEISCGGVVVNNKLLNNSVDSAGLTLWYGAQIYVHDSPNVTVYNNTVTVTNGGNGIGLRDSIRPIQSGKCYYSAANDYVHDNTVKMKAGSETGLVADRTEAFTSWNNRFVHDTYYVPSLTGGFWEWNAQSLNKTQWQAAGQDITGVFNTW